MKSLHVTLLGSALTLLLSSSAWAQTTFNNGGMDSAWTTAANWTAGVPISTSAVQIGAVPTGGIPENWKLTRVHLLLILPA